MKCLVTGACGFIGSHIEEHLLKAGHEVVILDNTDTRPNDNDGRWYHVSIEDHAQIDRIFKEQHFDYVFHCAAYAAEGLSHFIKRFNYENNLIGSVNLINAAVNHDVKGFVFTSSIAVYGSAQVPMTEDMIPQPEDSYGIAKYAVEQELQISHDMFGLNYIIFRPHNVYGPRQNIGDCYRNVVGILMNQLLKGEPFTIFGDGEQSRAFSYIDDVAPVIANSINVPAAWNQVFNIGADDPVTINRLAHLIEEVSCSKIPRVYLRERKEVRHAFCDHTKLKQVFGDRPSTPLKDGLAKMWEWVKEYGARETPKFKNIEITKNLPPSWL